MKLVEAHVRLYQNITDSNPVKIEPDATCLVGKNESGKTTFLQALRNLNPAHEGEMNLDATLDYPRWRLKRDQRKGNLQEVAPVTGVFQMDEDDLEAISQAAGFPVPGSALVVAERDYGRNLHVGLRVEEPDVVASIVDEVPLGEDIKEEACGCETIAELRGFVKRTREEGGEKRLTNALKTLSGLANKAEPVLSGDLTEDIEEALAERLPRFFYFSEYSNLPGRLDLTELLAMDEANMSENQRTAMSLLRMSGVGGEEFTGEDLEVRIAELEASANAITGEVFRYWRQNTDLQVTLVGSSRTVPMPHGQTAVHDQVDIRLNDTRHQVTTNLARRSSGFRWFFSFIAAFSEFEDDANVIVLLDEPGLNLHGRAQEDFLLFIEERLAQRHQVLYTTHSPFMVQASKLDRVRLLEDHSSRMNPDAGAKISSDVLAVHGDTIFPLQAALGYDLAQNLFVGGSNLIVEGTSDYVYLEALSEHLGSLGREPLLDAWTIVPVGGADKVPTFGALLGAHLRDITVLLDASNTGNQRLADLAEQGILDSSRIITVASITGTKKADIEDLFEPGEYLRLYNAAFGEKLTEDDLHGSDPILRRIERHRGSTVDHRPPSTALLRDKAEFFDVLSDATLNRFEALFKKINATHGDTTDTRELR